MDSTQKAVCKSSKPKVVNVGIKNFYDALIAQDVQAVQLDWTPPIEQSKEILDLLDDLL